MNDNAIRIILKQWLKANASDKGIGIRIFYEKAISNSIADVLAVTEDGIWGFEIKSDVDDLRRLNTQLDNYSKACDRCYVVVGERNVEKVKSCIPRFCGVLKWKLSCKNHQKKGRDQTSQRPYGLLGRQY
jgi:hypothetical protein